MAGNVQRSGRRALAGIPGNRVAAVGEGAQDVDLADLGVTPGVDQALDEQRHRSVRELVASIRTWITNWNDDPKPFVWHKSADQILDSLAAYCQRINDSGH